MRAATSCTAVPAAEALHRAADAAWADGESTGYVIGWHWGVVSGVCLGFPAGLLVAILATQLGMRWL